MTHAPRISDESVLARWMNLEISRMNEGVVGKRKLLSVLLTEKDPSAVTRKGGMYSFDKTEIKKMAEKLPGPLQIRLNLPILFYTSPDVPDSCSCPDEFALTALQLLGEISTL